MCGAPSTCKSEHVECYTGYVVVPSDLNFTKQLLPPRRRRHGPVSARAGSCGEAHTRGSRGSRIDESYTRGSRGSRIDESFDRSRTGVHGGYFLQEM